MADYRLTFESPFYLALLGLLPVIWWYGFRRLAALGRIRQLLVIALRTLVLVLLVLALAGVQMVRMNDQLTVIYLLDQSLSIPAAQRRAMIDYVNAEIQKHRVHESDRVGVVVFGRDAAIEIPPFDDWVQVPPVIEAPLDPQNTNLAGAIKLAQASFPEDAAKRIVVVSDGNQNLGNAAELAEAAAGAGIGIDVVPVYYEARSEVVVERLTLPADIRRAQPFDMKVVVSNTSEPAPGKSGEVAGRLVISQLAGAQPVVLSDERVTLPPGKRVFSIRQRIDEPNFYSYEARFIPDRPQDDAMPQNNRATAFTHIRGKGQVLLIEDREAPGEFDQLVKRLRAQGLEITVRSTNELFTTPSDLLPFDTVLLANVPREQFSDDQIEILVRNTQQMGCGLVMLGGPNSFGAGGWTNTELEKAMPVDFQIENAKVVPKGALVMLMHACEIPEGNFWQKVIAHEAIKALGPQDYCGLIHWNGTEQWLWGGRTGMAEVGRNRNRMMGAVDRMTPGDMPDFDPGMRMALAGFRSVQDAAIKHMIIISDGDPTRPSWSVIKALRDPPLAATISTVAVGAHGPAQSQLLKDIADAAGGKYYAVQSPKALPRIFQREARRVARPLIFDKYPVQPQVKDRHDMLSGIGPVLPAIRGFVLTTKKDNPLVEVPLVSPQPAGLRNGTILATWTFGLGRAIAFTSDCGARWTTDWLADPIYDKLFGQVITSSMRPSGDTGKFTVSTEMENDEVRVVVSALDKNDEFLNFLNMTGSAVGPDLKSIPLKLEQTAPGRYVGAFPARDAGSYFVVVSPGLNNVAPILTGVNVPYSEEFRDRATNAPLLRSLAQSAPRGGQPGQVIEAAPGAKLPDGLLAVDTFRHGELAKATSSQDIWHFLVLVGACLFFFDVFFRRVQVSVAWVPPLLGRVRDRILRRQAQAGPSEAIERLRSRKAEVAGQIEQLRSDARFEPAPDPDAQAPDLKTVLDQSSAPAASKPTPPSLTREEKSEEELHTERLLRAKKDVWKDRQ